MTTQAANAILPGWFRGLLIATATLVLCGCQTPLPQDQAVEPVGAPRENFSTAGSPRDPSSATNDLPAANDLPTAQEASVPPAIETVQFQYEVSPSDCETCENGSCQSGDCESGACHGGCPAGAPCGPVNCSLRGPRDEYLCDGGDCGPRVDVNKDWTLDGLEQEDTVAMYDTLDGRTLVEPSNKVCIYAPRFGAVRRVTNASEALQPLLVNVVEEDASLHLAAGRDEPAGALQNLPPVISIGEDPAGLLRNRQQAGEFEARVVVRELRGMIKPYCNVQLVRVGVVDNAEKPWLAKAIVSALTWTGDQAPQVAIESKAASVMIGAVSPGVVYSQDGREPCLRLVKLASTDNARPGEEVEFTLRFDNVGGEEIGNVAIVDSLTTRLEYVPDTAEASVEASFTTSENSAGSLILRWELKEPLKPGEGGLLQFKARVR